MVALFADPKPLEMSAEEREKLLGPGTEEMYLREHRRILGRTLSFLRPQLTCIYVTVVPTPTTGRIPDSKSGIVWADVDWNGLREEYSCVIHNLPGETSYDKMTWSSHPSFKSALRRARKQVAKHNQLLPEKGWTNRLTLKPLESVFLSGWELEMALNQRRWIEYDMEMFLADLEEDDTEPWI